MDQLPAGALGYIVVNNVKATTGNVEKFLGTIGLGDMLGEDMPGGLVQMIQGMARLGEGFNPNGGAAAVMLDPEQFGVDLVQMIMGQGRKPEGAPAEQPKLPFVIIVPGTGVKEVFGMYETAPAGRYTEVKLRMGKMFAADSGGYVLLSPTPKALDAILAANKKAASELPAEQRALLSRADLGMHINMKVVAPIFNKFTAMIEQQIAGMQQMQQQMAEEGQPMPPTPDMQIAGLVAPVMGFYRELISQMESVTAGVRLAQSGIVVEEMASFVPDSALGRMMAAYGVSDKPPLNRLPNLPYVLAMGALIPEGEAKQQIVKLSQDMLEKILALPALAKLSDETKAKTRKLVADYNNQVTGVQIVAGGAPEGSGVFGLSIVLQCKDAATLRGLLAEEVALADEIIKTLIQGPEAQQLKLTYDRSIDSIGDGAVDSITVSHPELLELDEDERAEMTKIIGEDKIRFLVASADDKTVVVTFGGGKAFLAEALKAGKGGGTILTAAQTEQAMTLMPKNCSVLMLINVGNLFDVITTAMKVIDPDEVLPFRIKTKTPIAYGGGVTGGSGHVVLHIPNELIAEAVAVFKSMMAPPPPPGQPGRGPDDF